MGFGKLTGLKIKADAGLHLVISLVIFSININTVLSLHDYATAVAFGAVLLIASLLQALYHFGLLLRTGCSEEEEELPVGSILRNLLTGVGLVSSVALYAQLVRLGKQGGDNSGITVAVILFALMRILDTIMNGKYEDGLNLWKHSCKDDETALVGGGAKAVYFTPRVLLVHIILGCTIVASSFDLASGLGYLRPVEGEASTVSLIFALILQSIHFLLYPLAAMLNACGFGSGVMGGEEECKGRNELVSLNRIPLFRSVVALVILSCLSYAYGNLTPVQPTQLLLVNLGLYFAADQIGFDVV